MDEDFDMSSDEGTDIVDDTVQDDVGDEIEDESEDEIAEDEFEDEIAEDESEDEISENELEDDISEDEESDVTSEIEESTEETEEDVDAETEEGDDESDAEESTEETEEDVDTETEEGDDESDAEESTEETEEDVDTETEEGNVETDAEGSTEEAEEDVDAETEEDTETDVEGSTEETEEDVDTETEEGDVETDAEESTEEAVDAETEEDTETEAEESTEEAEEDVDAETEEDTGTDVEGSTEETEEDVDAEAEEGDNESDAEESTEETEEDVDAEAEEGDNESDVEGSTEETEENIDIETDAEESTEEAEENVDTEPEEGENSKTEDNEDTKAGMSEDEAENEIRYENNRINDSTENETGEARDILNESSDLLEGGSNGVITSETKGLTNSEKHDIATSFAKTAIGIGKSILRRNYVADLPTHITNTIEFCSKINKAYFKELPAGENEGKFKSLVRPFFEATGKINDMMVAVDRYASAGGESLNASTKLALAAGMLSTNGNIEKHTMATFKAAGELANDATGIFRKGIPKTPSDVRDRLTKAFDAGKQVENFSKEWLEAKYGTSDIPKEVAKAYKTPERVMAWVGRHSAIIKEHNEYKEAMKEYHSNIKRGVMATMPTAPERKYSFTDKTLNACGKINDFLSKVNSANNIAGIAEGNTNEETKIVDYGLNHGINKLVDFSQKHDIINKFRDLFKI